MRATSVIARFLSLLDVTLLLLGVLMLTLAKAQLQSDDPNGPEGGSAATPELRQVANLQFIYLYAGWKSEQSGKCFLLGPNWEITREIRTDTDSGIVELVGTNSLGGMASMPVIFLLFPEDGWFSAWPAERIRQIESTWRTPIVPVYNVQIPSNTARR